MKNKSKKKALLIVISCILAVIICVVFLVRYFSPYEFGSGRNISEVFGFNLDFTETEEENLTLLLQSMIAEDEQYIGFQKISGETDLYYANSVMELSDTLGNTELVNLIGNKMNVLGRVNVASLDILNLTYYVSLCDKSGIIYNADEIIMALEKFYDEEAELFFLNNADDTINIKLTITALCCNVIPEILDCEQFEILDGVNNAYENYEFNIDTTTTLYNSGGDILNCMSVVGLLEENIIDSRREWFDSWKNYYEGFEIDSIEIALAYMEFYKIAVLFDEDYPNEKLQNYYDGLTVEEAAQISDLYMVNNVLEYVKVLDNTEVNSYFADSINSSIEEGRLYEADIDLLETACGVRLALELGYEIDTKKLQNYINESYNSIDDMELLVDKVNYLYYTIILDELNNDFKLTCNASYLQEVIDECIKELKFKDDILSDVILARKLVEIVFDAQIHDVDVQLTNGQVDKIIKGMKKAVKQEKVISSVAITDLYILDDILDVDVISQELFDEKYKLLTVDGGSSAYPGENTIADIYTTHRFFSCYDRVGIYDELEEQKAYIETLSTEEGIYGYSVEGYISLESVLYGNDISKFSLGGSKND